MFKATRRVFVGGQRQALALLMATIITHNMHRALELGNRTLMMDGGDIVLDVKGRERSGISVDDLLETFTLHAEKKMDSDRILFAKSE